MTTPSFDPCKQWLGIDAVDLGDPRRVLGLPPNVVDAPAIARAAAIKLSLLQSVAPGPFAMAHAALLQRVTEARDALLAEAAAAAGPTFSMPPPPSAARPIAPMPPPMPGAPPLPGSGPAVPLPSDGFAAAASTPGTDFAFTTRAASNYKPRSSVGPVFSLVVAGLSIVAGVMGYRALQPKPKPPAGDGRDVAMKREPALRAKAVRTTVKTTSGTPTTRDENRAISNSPSPEQQEKGHVERQRSMKGGGAPAEDSGADAAPKQNQDQNPEPSVEEAPREREPVDDNDAADATPDTAPANTPAPAPPPAAPVADANVERLLRAAFASLQAQEFAAAKASLEAADEATSDEAMEDRIASFEELLEYAQKFSTYRDQALANVRPGIEYDVPTAASNRHIAIIDLDDEKLVFKEAGQTTRIPRDKIPAALLTHIVREWFDERAENHLFLGAYFATKPEPDLAKAREEWTTAQVEGADAAGLIPLLDDPILTATPE